jgi:hypothetical protein
VEGKPARLGYRCSVPLFFPPNPQQRMGRDWMKGGCSLIVSYRESTN